MLSEITQSIIRLYDELAKVQFEEDNLELVEFRDGIEFELGQLNELFNKLKENLYQL